MEIHSATTRFTLICNYVSRIIDPIASRCSKFRFKTLAGVDAGGRLKEIAEKENVRYEDGVIEKLLDVSEGDMRRAVTYLQSSFNLTSAAAAAAASTKGKRGKRIIDDDSDEEMTDSATNESASAVVTINTVLEIAGTIPPKVINDLVAAMQPNARGSLYGAVSKQITDMVADGWSANQVLSQLYTVLIGDETLEPRKKLQIFAIFSEVDKALVNGVDEHIAAMDLSLRIAAVLGGKK